MLHPDCSAWGAQSLLLKFWDNLLSGVSEKANEAANPLSAAAQSRDAACWVIEGDEGQ